MKRWFVIGTALVFLAMLVGGMLRHQSGFHSARSAASRASTDEHAMPAASAGPERATPAASITPTDVHTMRYLQTLLETWKSNAQTPTLRQP